MYSRYCVPSILGTVYVNINFKISMSISIKKKLAEILVVLELNPYTNFRVIDIFTMLSLPIHEHDISFY